MCCRFLNASSLSLLLLTIVGCGESSPVVSEPNPFQAAAANAKVVNDATEAAAQPVSAVKQVADKVADVYEPPFPDRQEMFSPPKQGSRPASQSNDNNADSVVLLGFAKLDEPQVVLAINGIVKPLGTGEEAYGVQVISITPPRAVLQRGRSRWTASIE